MKWYGTWEEVHRKIARVPAVQARLRREAEKIALAGSAAHGRQGRKHGSEWSVDVGYVDAYVKVKNPNDPWSLTTGGWDKNYIPALTVLRAVSKGYRPWLVKPEERWPRNGTAS